MYTGLITEQYSLVEITGLYPLMINYWKIPTGSKSKDCTQWD
jgi:hypothetical protein